ncbi:fungal-specific transcription factor domain-containing protein [Xylaria digitata]|nr:fungal-specific transcription factor domain-containing protein [Xylaria digitata]
MAGDSEPQKKPPLSCTSCRARKLKCDKQNPCRNCERSGSECVFPARKRIQRPRKTKNAELLQRLNRLESIVGRVGLANLEEIEAQAETVDAQAMEPLHPAPSSLKGVRPARDSTASRYMSGEFWSSLCDEVGGLRQALEQFTDSDEEDDGGEGTTPESVGGSGTNIPIPPGILLGIPQTRSLPAIEHPSSEHIRYLASVFFRNVDLHLKILHRPTILKALYNLADYPETASDLSHELTAVLFAIYYASITSLTPVECADSLGRPQADLATLFQAGIEQALARADYLNNTSLETLQALTLYVCCLRSHNGSRASWALLGVPIRLAQALNIHQDGDGTNSRFSPFEAEQRRRLWWQLIVLDTRAAEDRGTNTVIARGSYDTRLPHNIDDVEFGPDTTTPLQDRPGPSDITFSLFTAQTAGIWSEYEPQKLSKEETARCAKQLELQFVKGADPEHVASYLASVTVRLIILKMWLVTRYPLHRRDRNSGCPPAHLDASRVSASSTTNSYPTPVVTFPESTLRTAVSIMELSDFLETGPYSDRIRWWTESWVQWHPLAVALAELCAQTTGAVVEHAWRVIDVVFPRWSNKIADLKRGSLWRPIRKLYKKAKAAHKAAVSTREPSQPQSQAQAQSPSTWEKSASISTPECQLNGIEHMAIDPALTAGSSSIRPKLITDMILSESSAHTLTSEWPMPYTKIAGATSTSTTQNPISQNQMETSTGSTPFSLDATMDDPGQSIAHALLGWPDMSFDIAAADAYGPIPVTTSTVAGEGSMATNPPLLDPTMMNWTTWEEFVLDTYADTTPKSASWGSEGT